MTTFTQTESLMNNMFGKTEPLAYSHQDAREIKDKMSTVFLSIC